MKKLWTDLHSNIHHNQMDELDKWTEHAKRSIRFLADRILSVSDDQNRVRAGLEDLCPEEEIKKDWEIVRGKVKRRKCKRISDVYGI